MKAGHATPEGTARYASRHGHDTAFYRDAGGLQLSSLGLGSYLGPMDEATDAGYTAAAAEALRTGINVLDTSLNYRHQRSERALGAAIAQVAGEVARDEFVIATKAGYLVPNAQPDTLRHTDTVGGLHCLTPAFLADQCERSRQNLGVETIDIFYLHNPETQLDAIGATRFYERMAKAFEALEGMVKDGRIAAYGTATWNGYREKKGGLNLTRLVDLARAAGGVGHHFRFIQLPFNLGMVEALANRDEAGHNVLEYATEYGLTVMASASILQAQLVRQMPPVVKSTFVGFDTNAQCAIQFTRSTPGITTALVGMSKVDHVRENLGVKRRPPAPLEQYASLFS
jgi:aryl-alcohol dehydrogenase-like predicted oxidoreductase